MAFGSIWKFGADNSEYKKAVREMPSELDKSARQIESRTKQMGASMSGALRQFQGILAGGMALAGLKSLMNDFDRVGKLATRFGTSAESIQRVGVAAKVAGTDVEAVANAMTKAGIAASKAVEGGGQMAELFDRAGINAREFANANIDEKLLMIAEAYRAAGNDAQKTNAIIEIMGSRAGGNLIPLISNVEALRAEMANVSVASDETVRQIEQANDRMTRFGNTIKVAFAGGLQLATEFSERVGSIMGGGGGRTIAEMEEAEMRANAEARLRARGELLQDDSTRRSITIPTPAGPVISQADEFVPGPNAEENVRRVNAELAVMRAELAEAAKATGVVTDELDEQVSKTEERKNQQRQLKQLSLEIREAEAAGNQALANDLREYEALVKAAINYEGDLEMAARDVNAAHKERLRLQQEALQKSIEQVEKEIQLAEAMAFGTEEAKSRAEWMKAYDATMAKTGREDLARRAANAATADTGATSRSGGGGGRSNKPFDPVTGFGAALRERGSQAVNFDPATSRLSSTGLMVERTEERFSVDKTAANIRADLARMENRNRSAAERADRFEQAGQFGAAERLRGRIERRVAEEEKRLAEKYNLNVQDMSKTPEERAREEEEARAKHGAKGAGKSDMAKDIADILKKIKEHLPNIDEKLPQTALVYS